MISTDLRFALNLTPQKAKVMHTSFSAKFVQADARNVDNDS
jgi:hypothetical protein